MPSTVMIWYGNGVVFIEEYSTLDDVMTDLLVNDLDWTSAMEFKVWN